MVLSAKSAIQDDAIRTAKSLPELVNNLNAVGSPLAQQLEGKSLAASKSPWGTLAVAGVSWLVAKYGLGWDTTTVDLVAGAGLLVGAYLMRLVTSAPIAGWFRKPPAKTTP